jgi:hypothetical protein
LLRVTNRFTEAEPLYRRALAINEASHGPDHPDIAIVLNNLALLLHATNRLSDAEPLMPRTLAILFDFERKTKHAHPLRDTAVGNYARLLAAMGKSQIEIKAAIAGLTAECGAHP